MTKTELAADIFHKMVNHGECSGITVGNLRELSESVAGVALDEVDRQISSVVDSMGEEAVRGALISGRFKYLNALPLKNVGDGNLLREDSWKKIVLRAMVSLASQEFGDLIRDESEHIAELCIRADKANKGTVARQARKSQEVLNDSGKRDYLVNDISFVLLIAARDAVNVLRGLRSYQASALQGRRI